MISPLACFFLGNYSEVLFNGYRFGFEMLLVMGFLLLSVFSFSAKIA